MQNSNIHFSSDRLTINSNWSWEFAKAFAQRVTSLGAAVAKDLKEINLQYIFDVAIFDNTSTEMNEHLNTTISKTKFYVVMQNVSNGQFQIPDIETTHFVTFGEYFTGCPTLNRIHHISSLSMIKCFLNQARGGELVNFKEPLLTRLIGTNNMIACPFSDHSRLRVPVERTFTHRSINSTDVVHTIHELAENAIFSMANKYIDVEFDLMDLYSTEFSLHTLMRVLSVNEIESEHILPLLKVLKKHAFKPENSDLNKILHEWIKSERINNLQKLSTLSEEEQVDTLLLLIFAGTATTSESINFLLELLIMHPNIKNGIEKEYTEFVKNECSAQHDINSIQQYLQRKDTLLHHSYLETLRLYPIVPVIRRVANKDFDFGSHLIFKGDLIELNIMAAQRDPVIWGENSNAFHPERFRNASHLESLLNNFSPGKTPCLGKHLAELEIKMMGLVFCRSQFNKPLSDDLPVNERLPAYTYNLSMLRHQ